MKTIDIIQIQSKNGLDILEVNGYLLHSKYNPIKEAEKFIEKEFKEDQINILFGYGKGYFAEQLSKKVDLKKLIVVEPFIELIEEDLNYTIILADNIEALSEKIKSVSKDFRKEFNIICSPNYDKIAPRQYLRILKEIKTIQITNAVNEKTIRLASESWQENHIKNLINAVESKSLKSLHKSFNIPVIVASGGPSLTKQLPKLKEIRDKVILIASGTTINSLLKENIEPDFIVTIDGAAINYEHFKNIKVEKASLVYCLSSNYMIQADYSGEKYLFTRPNSEKLNQRIKNNLGVDLVSFLGGGSVAHYAYSLALYITTGPIAFIGQDLAYTDGLSHAANNLNTKSVSDVRAKLFEVDGYYGDKVVTSTSLFVMKKDFETMFKALSHDSSVYNCTEGGVKLEGIEQQSFEEFINMSVLNENFSLDDKLNQKTEPEDILAKVLIIEKMLIEDLNKYSKLQTVLEELLNLCEKLKGKNVGSKTLNKFNSLDKKMKKLLDDVMMEEIVQPLIIDVMRKFEAPGSESKNQEVRRIYTRNTYLYKQLLTAVDKTKQFTEEAIKMVEKKKEQGNNV